ncbi:FRG domain-containing protein [Phocaeicola massiliensis]|uniref:FRG domain-containing protein n=1 Tax=Phocaeicola massiliensis TaxID=204516 RepID=UPI000E3F7B64|nr:FRG domain-containing protein [Phocaeicola massiliensis]RGF20873.1 FRG domain-containing protein [Bacteroides sp. AM16-15]
MRKITPHLTNDFFNKGITASNVANHDAYDVLTYEELRKLIAKLSYANKDFILFFRGQRNDYKNKSGKSSFYPSMYRGEPLNPEELKFRWEKLHSASKLLVKSIADKKFKTSILKRKKLIQWSILQHYEVTETPLIDVTQSLKVACSFASLDNDGEYGYIFVFGLPYYTNRISVNSEHYLTNIRLISIAPPEALRPYFQEGFLIGEDEFNETYDKKIELDLSNRLIAKFRFPNNANFWGNSERMFSRKDLYPENDPIELICAQIKKELFSGVTMRKDISAEYYKEFMLKWVEIENELKHLYTIHKDKTFVAPAVLIKYIENKELQNELNNIRIIRNKMIHNADFKKQLPIKNLENALSDLKEYIRNKL